MHNDRELTLLKDTILDILPFSKINQRFDERKTLNDLSPYMLKACSTHALSCIPKT